MSRVMLQGSVENRNGAFASRDDTNKIRSALPERRLASPFGDRGINLSPWRGLLRLLAFFALLAGWIFATNEAIDYGIRKVRTSSFGVWNRITEGRINTDILISGSSRALTHYDARIIERATGHSTFNIGLNGSQTDMQLARLKVYLAHNSRPRLLIQNLDLFSFVTSHEIYDPGQYVAYLGEDAIYTGVRRVYPYAWKWKYLPLYGYAVEDMRLDWFAGVGALFGVQPREDHYAGYHPRNTGWTGDFEKFRDANPKGIVIASEPQGIADFEELLQLCASNQIPLLVVYSPEYLEMQLIERNRAEILGVAKKLAERYGDSVWDYSDSALCRDRGNFYNSQHLNVTGAASFSEDLGQRLRGMRGL